MEHFLFVTSKIYTNYKQVTICKLVYDNFIKRFFMKERPHWFMIIQYHPIIGVILEWMIVSMTFCWNYVDVLIVTVCISLTTRFNQINKRLLSLHGRVYILINLHNLLNLINFFSLKKMSISFWKEIRENYINAIQLLELVDKRFSTIIMLSCLFNLYFICIQLFHSFT